MKKEIFRDGGVLIGLFAIGGVMLIGISFIIHMFAIFPAEGDGIIIEKLHKGKRGAAVVVVSPDQYRVEVNTPFNLWETLQEGDFLKKKKYSLMYYVNQSPHNALLSIVRMSVSLGIGMPLALLFFLGCGLLVDWLKKLCKSWW